MSSSLCTPGRPRPQPQLILDDLTEAIYQRLLAEGVRDLADWRKLSLQRKASIFGITRSMVREIDALARQVAWS
jgi:hypothetical protein